MADEILRINTGKWNGDMPTFIALQSLSMKLREAAGAADTLLNEVHKFDTFYDAIKYKTDQS